MSSKIAAAGPQPAQPALVSFIFSTPVWGAGHVGLFLNVCLPSLLAPNNLPCLKANSQNKFLVYTRPEDEADIAAAPTFKRLADLVPTEIIIIREEITEPHRTMSDCHVDSLRQADEAGAAAVFLPPDCIWSDGSMRRLEELANTGKSVVHMSGIRLDRDAIVPELASRYSDNNSVLSMPARDLVRLGLQHLHPIALTHFWNEYDGGLMPANLVWTIPGEGLLLRCFHLHPLLVKTQIPFAKFDSTIDDDLALRACPDASRDYVVSDSDELLAFEMSGLSRVVGTVCPKGSVEGVAGWAEIGTNMRHRELIRHSIRLHSGIVNEQAWAATETESNQVVDDVAALNALSLRDLAFQHPAIFNARIYAISLGRGQHGGQLVAWVRFLVWLRGAILSLNANAYSMVFLKHGAPLITHPYWLVRRSILAAIAQCLGRDDRHIVLIGGDPGLALQVEQACPGVTVQAFAAGAVPDAGLVRRGKQREVDLLLTIDVGTPDADTETAPAPQHVGLRKIILRMAGDRRPADGQEVRHFGRLGTRFCYALWARARLLRKRLRPNSPLAGLPLKAIGLLLMPLLYGAIALIGITMNVTGLILDSLPIGQTPPYASKEPRPHGPPA